MRYPVQESDFTMTCSACPSQWEGITRTGDYVYIRYRWGRLAVGVGSTMDEAVTINISHTPTFSKILDSDGWDGMLSTQEMMEHTAPILDWNATVIEADRP